MTTTALPLWPIHPHVLTASQMLQYCWYAGEQMRRRLKHISEELAMLASSLPLTLDSAILVAVDEERVDVLRACCFPAPGTPYAW